MQGTRAFEGLGLWSLDPRRQNLWWSEQVYHLHDIPTDTPVTLDYALSFYAPEHQRQMRDHLRRALEDRTPWDTELRLVTAKGRSIWVRSQGMPQVIDRAVALVMGTLHDISPLRKAEAALLESEVLFQSLATNVPGLISLTNPRGEVVYFNPRWVEFLGPSNQNQRSFWEQRVHPEDIASCRTRFQLALASQSPFERVFRLRRQDGLYRWILERGVPRFNSQQEFAGYLTTGMDISEERQLRDKLACSERRLKDLMDRAPVGLFLADAEGNLTYANQAFEKTTGAHCRICRDKGWTRLLHPLDRSPFIESWKRFTRNRIPFDRGYRFLTREGQERWVRIEAVPLSDSEALSRYLGVMQDITDLKTTERHLDEKQTYLSGVVNANPDLILLMSVDGYYLDCFIDPGNDLVQERDQMIGKNARETLPAELAEQLLESVRRCIETGEVVTVEYELQVRGELRHYEARISRVSDDKAIFIIRNITERKEEKAALVKAKEEAQMASEAKSSFLARMSHEIRTPLNGIVGMTGLLLDSAMTQEQLESVQTIRHCSEALLSLVNDILDLSKIEAGKLDLEPHPFELLSLIRSAVDMVSGPALSKNLCMQEDLAESLPCWVIGDSAKLRQILVNLLSNAVKFTEEGGKVCLTVTAKKNLSGPSGLYFTVSDSGIGIPPERLELLFSPFQQGDNTVNRRFGGTGLGLSITKSLVEKMGGGIQLTSELGKGTQVSFYIVLQEKIELGKPSAAILPLPNLGVETPLRILVAEDNPINQKFALRLLSKLGYRADLVADGSEAVEAALRQPYDIVFMDIQMPETDGLVATHQIRSRLPRERQPRIIAMTAAAIKGDREKALAVGMNDYLCKPVKVEELVRVLRETRPRANLDGLNRFS